MQNRNLTSVQRYINHILMHIAPSGHWKNGWNSALVAKKYDLTRQQVAAVKAHFTMGRYLLSSVWSERQRDPIPVS